MINTNLITILLVISQSPHHQVPLIWDYSFSAWISRTEMSIPPNSPLGILRFIMDTEDIFCSRPHISTESKARKRQFVRTPSLLFIAKKENILQLTHIVCWPKLSNSSMNLLKSAKTTTLQLWRMCTVCLGGNIFRPRCWEPRAEVS